ncbi:hypothetical protein LCGC14_2869070, partial [marine sediment metagenome]
VREWAFWAPSDPTSYYRFNEVLGSLEAIDDLGLNNMTTKLLPENTATSAIGRPTLLTSKLIEQVAGLVGKGNYISTACQIVGIGERTYYDWLERASKDESEESIYSQFSQAIKRAESDAEARRVERIEQAGIGGGLIRRRTTTTKDGTEILDEQYAQPNWLADMTHLERRHPDRWGRKDRTRIDVSGKVEHRITQVETILNMGEGTPQVIEGESRELKEGE